LLDSFCEREFSELGLEIRFVRVNNSRGMDRGMHWERVPSSTSCGAFAVDAILDLRPGSPTFGQSFGAELSGENRRMTYCPRGFAHRFVTLEPDTEAFYLVSAFYDPARERWVRWNDPRFAISWPAEPVVISDKDKNQRDFDPV
jgi:dTDP-4-dehydrorhamnose 3,5-epimerase